MDEKKYIHQLLKHLSKTEKQEATCDEVFDVLDIYTEAVAQGEDAGKILPLIRQHLEFCHCCREEYEVLLEILEVNQNS